MSDVGRKHLTLCDAERANFGASHAQLGAYLLGLWGFNDNIVEAVAYHHCPSDAGPAPSRVLTLVHAAQYLMRSSNTSKARRDAPGPLDSNHLQAIGLIDQMLVWRATFDSLAKEWAHA
jgi:HD-like signal output (HDOD) protein